jgi:hypothetical protein
MLSKFLSGKKIREERLQNLGLRSIEPDFEELLCEGVTFNRLTRDAVLSRFFLHTVLVIRVA